MVGPLKKHVMFIKIQYRSVLQNFCGTYPIFSAYKERVEALANFFDEFALKRTIRGNLSEEIVWLYKLI